MQIPIEAQLPGWGLCLCGVKVNRKIRGRRQRVQPAFFCSFQCAWQILADRENSTGEQQVVYSQKSIYAAIPRVPANRPVV